eukprot:scaffold124951_cov42-Phaeocystis_antarctica.AAC.1
MQYPSAVSFWYAISVWCMGPSIHSSYPVSIGGTQYPFGRVGGWVVGRAAASTLDTLEAQTAAARTTYGCSL